MIRQPTNRAAAWEHWRRRTAGEALATHTSQPECGWYRAKRAGRYVAVQIDLVQDIDPETGELCADEGYVAFIHRDSFYDQDRVEQIWMYCSGSPITEAQAEALLRMPAVTDLTRDVII